MASNEPNSIIEKLTRPGGTVSEQLTSITEQLQQLKAINDVLTAERNVVLDSGTNTSGGGGSVVDSILNAVTGGIGGIAGGLGLAPLISGITGLFSDDNTSTGPNLSRYVPPLPIELSAGVSAFAPREPFAVDSSQGGLSRAVTTSQSPSVKSPQITIQVQAMDSRSFLDHSQDIANAVRQAMLETTLLNDVIREI